MNVSRINEDRIGSDFDDFLSKVGILEEVTAMAHKKIIASQIKQVMEEKHITKS